MRWLQYGAVGVLVILVVLIAVSVYQLRGIIQEKAAEQKKLEALQKDNQIAVEALKQKRKEVDELTINADKLRIEANALKKGLASSGSEIAKSVLEKVARETSDESKTPPRIYIQIAREDQRPKATQMVNQLQAKGYLVPGIENVGSKAPPTSDVRYCKSDSGELQMKDLADITGFLKSSVPSLQSLGSNVIPDSLCSKVRPRQYEIWFGQDFK